MRAAVIRLARRADPVWFAMVMATGIVSAALRQAGWPGPARSLLGAAAACFVDHRRRGGLAGRRSARQASAAELGRPQRVFTAFAAVAACGVSGQRAGRRRPAGRRRADRGRDAGRRGSGAVAGPDLLGCHPPGGGWSRAGRPVTAVNGTWYLWTVGTQSLAIAAAFLHVTGVLGTWPAAAAAIAAWSAGLVLYLAIMVLVMARLLSGRPAPGGRHDALLGGHGRRLDQRLRRGTGRATARHCGSRSTPGVTGGGVTAWILATCLVPALAAFSVARPAAPAPAAVRHGGLGAGVSARHVRDGRTGTGHRRRTATASPRRRGRRMARRRRVGRDRLRDGRRGAHPPRRRCTGRRAGTPDRRPGGQTEPGTTAPAPAPCSGETAQVTR